MGTYPLAQQSQIQGLVCVWGGDLPFSTVVTDTGSGPGVDLHVVLQVVGAVEAFVARRAGEFLLLVQHLERRKTGKVRLVSERSPIT